MLGGSPPSIGETRELVVIAGRPLRVALDSRVRVQREGQSVAATLVEPVYAFDRIVVPQGTKVIGLIERLERPTAGARLGRALQFDFSPARPTVLRFERLVMSDGQELAITTRVGPGTVDMVRQSANEPGHNGMTSGARRRVTEAIAKVKKRGRMRRLKDAFLASLPFHRQYLREGTVYDAELLAPLSFGTVTPTPRAPEGENPPLDSILTARLVTPVDSARTPRNSPIEAVLTQPLFSADKQLIFPEGTLLRGEVTFAKRAGHFHRNGQLRMLFDKVQPEARPEQPLLASLHSAETGRGARLSVDDEGGATITNTKTRFIAPALSAAAVGASMARESVYDPGEAQFSSGATEANTLGTGASGFAALGVLGLGVSQAYRPAGVVLGFAGLARNVYGSVFGKGREVSFRAGTRIQVQLASEPVASK